MSIGNKKKVPLSKEIGTFLILTKKVEGWEVKIYLS